MTAHAIQGVTIQTADLQFGRITIRRGEWKARLRRHSPASSGPLRLNERPSLTGPSRRRILVQMTRPLRV
jgi:hypothetical protein